MSRRFQGGSIEVSGKWYVVRFWKDIPGQERRIHASKRICPTSGPGVLNKTEQKRRALEIVLASGINDPRRFAEMSVGTTFREQAERFLAQKTRSKRRPIKPATLCTWRNCLEKWLNPNLGDLPLASINNAILRTLVEKMHDDELSAKTIVNYAGLVKLVVASAVDEDGEQLFPRKWNHEFVDLPIVRDQRRPAFDAGTIAKIVGAATGQERVLYALLAGGGLRIGEALGLEARHVSNDCRTLTIEQSVWNGKIQPPKTRNAYRDVDVCPTLASLLKEFLGDRQDGPLFPNGVGKPMHQSNLLRRSLHTILETLGVGKTGFHAFRRYRVTWLRKQRAPEDLIRFWQGQAASSVTDVYSKLADDVEFRHAIADSVGLGFELPKTEPSTAIPSVRNVRRKSAQARIGVAP